jgi:hypothetical protein
MGINRLIRQRHEIARPHCPICDVTPPNGQQSHQGVVAAVGGATTVVVVETIGVAAVGFGVWNKIRFS